MKKYLLILIIFLFGVLSVNIVKANELTDDYFDIATNYFNLNNYAKALEYLDLIISIEPGNLPAKVLRNKILPTVEEKTKVETEVIINEPEPNIIIEVPQVDIDRVTYDSNYYNKKGQELYLKEEYETAAEYFYKAISLNKRNAQAYNNLAMTYWKGKNNTYSAIKYFKKANFVNRRYTQPLVNLSNLYKQLGDVKKQVYYLKKAIRLNDNDYLAYYYLGDYYKNLGCYPKAIENYKEVVKINQKYAPVYLSLAACFFETEEFSYSILAAKQYLDLCPKSDFAYLLMAKSAFALCNYEDAKKYIQEAIILNSSEEYQVELAKISYYFKDYKAALEVFQKILETNETPEMFNYVGLCNYKLGNIELAIANFKKAIDLDGLRPIYYYNLAQAYKSLGDKRNYAKYVNTATKINPINYQDFIDLSYIYYDNANPRYAIITLNEAIKRYPDVKALYISKLKIYGAIGDSLNYNETKNLIDMKFNKK